MAATSTGRGKLGDVRHPVADAGRAVLQVQGRDAQRSDGRDEPDVAGPAAPVSRATFWATVILASTSLTRCEIGAEEPTQGHAVDTARAGADGRSAIRTDATRLPAPSAAAAEVSDLRFAVASGLPGPGHNTNLGRLLITAPPPGARLLKPPRVPARAHDGEAAGCGRK